MGDTIDAVSDEELIRRYCARPADREAGEELARRCMPRLEAAIRKLVFAKSSICPGWQDRHAFLEDAVMRASANLLRGVCTYRFEAGFGTWLNKLARNAAVDERRRILGRGKERRPPPEPLETVEPQLTTDGEMQPLFHSMYWKDPSAVVEDHERKQLVQDLLSLHAQNSRHDAESAGALRLRLWEEVTIREIAVKRGSSERDAYRLVAKDLKKLRVLLAEKFGVETL
jgi:RNA polymerase sigma factor (sigma-70 family)